MRVIYFILIIIYFIFNTKNVESYELRYNSILDIINIGLEDIDELEELLWQIMNLSKNGLNCYTIITDKTWINLFQGKWFNFLKIPYTMIVVDESEDLLSPNYDTLESIRLVRREGCKLYIIFLANGIQTSRLLKFGDRHRVLDTRANYIMLHDHRLFHSNFHYLWKRIINVVFIKHNINVHNGDRNSWFELSTIPFPPKSHNVLIPSRIETWKMDKTLKTKILFPDKTSTFNNQLLNIVILDHIPAVNRIKSNSSDILYTGIEIEIIKTLAKAMNFNIRFYEPSNIKSEQWGHKQLNGTFSGLLGEMVNGKADIALGNLHYTPYHLQLTDLTIPYISECLTFLTPESLTDNSWKTLILPFKLYMWITVLVVLLFSGLIFNCIANFRRKLIIANLQEDRTSNQKLTINKSFPKKEFGIYIFEELPNSILYTYGMLLVVSLPRLPSGWSLRLLTGWYWLYCVLVVVSYRASMTAILANPAPRVTIDTMKQLAESSIECGGWGDQTKDFFFTSLDEIGQKIGNKFIKINDANTGVELVAKGHLAYYENIHFLKYISANHKNTLKTVNESNETVSNSSIIYSDDRNLHIMKDCAIHMPISIGLQKNSPIKPKIDKLLRRIIEAGLIEKWLNDVMAPILSSSSQNEENIKALMNLQKLYGGFVALSIGYFVSFIALIAELVHWNYIVKKDPRFDKYAIHNYYSMENNS